MIRHKNPNFIGYESKRQLNCLEVTVLYSKGAVSSHGTKRNVWHWRQRNSQESALTARQPGLRREAVPRQQHIHDGGRAEKMLLLYTNATLLGATLCFPEWSGVFYPLTSNERFKLREATLKVYQISGNPRWQLSRMILCNGVTHSQVSPNDILLGRRRGVSGQ